MQEHVFSAGHIAQVRYSLENSDHLLGYSGSESSDQHDTVDQQPSMKSNNTMAHLKLPTPPPSVIANRASPGDMQHESNMTIYNQLLMQNPMFAAAAAASTNSGSNKLFGGEHENDSNAAITAAAAMMNFNQIQQHFAAVQQQQQQQQMNASENSENSVGNATDAATAAAHRLLMGNNLLLQINADQQSITQSTNSSEALLQQIYNYNQMSGELIK